MASNYALYVLPYYIMAGIFGFFGMALAFRNSNYIQYIIYLALYIIATIIHFMISTEKRDGERTPIKNSPILFFFYWFLYIICLVVATIIPGIIKK